MIGHCCVCTVSISGSDCVLEPCSIWGGWRTLPMKPAWCVPGPPPPVLAVTGTWRGHSISRWPWRVTRASRALLSGAFPILGGHRGVLCHPDMGGGGAHRREATNSPPPFTGGRIIEAPPQGKSDTYHNNGVIREQMSVSVVRTALLLHCSL